MIVGYTKTQPEKIKCAEYNPRVIDKENFEGLCESVRTFGIVQPFIVNRTTGNLVGGHQRLRAVIHLDTLYRGGDKDKGRRFKVVDVLEVELSEWEEKALNLALNSKEISGKFTASVNDLISELRVNLGDSYLKNLRVDRLQIDLSEWRSNINSIDKVKSFDDDTIMDKITIEVPVRMKDEVREFLRAQIDESGFEGVNVR